jgi:amidase
VLKTSVYFWAVNSRLPRYCTQQILVSTMAENPFEKKEDQDWTDIAAKAQTKLINSIPTEWRIPLDKLPPESQLDVTGFPKKCGLLSGNELKITESYATEILGAVAAGEWTAEEVTRAFCKRAAVAHQVVSFLSLKNACWRMCE